MASVGSFKKSGQEFLGEIATLSLQPKGVRMVPETNRTNDNAPSRPGAGGAQAMPQANAEGVKGKAGKRDLLGLGGSEIGIDGGHSLRALPSRPISRPCGADGSGDWREAQAFLSARG